MMSRTLLSVARSRTASARTGRTRVGRLTTIAAAVVLSLAAGALAARASTVVVAPGGTVASGGYAYWLERVWQLVFEAAPPAPNPCETVTADGEQVAVLTAGAPAPGTYRHACTEPAGRPIYVQQLANECSTFPRDHPGFGTTNADLERCARAGMAGSVATVAVDGHPLANFTRYLTATGVYSLQLPKRNLFEYKQLSGRSAAYGYGLLLTGMSAGDHTVTITGRVPSLKYTIAVTFNVHVG
jgi:hypothetical protein